MDESISIKFPTNIDHAKKSLVLSDYDDRIRFTGFAPEIGVAVIAATNDGTSLDELVAKRPLDALAIALVSASLKQEGILTNSPPYCTGKQLAAVLVKYYRCWNDELFSHLLWTSLYNGTASHSLVDGWLIESYHFIRGANARLCYAASLCSDQRIKAIFAHHYVEEYDHHTFFAESLSRRSIDYLQVDKIGPLPSTLAVLNMARRAARIDPLAYAACSGLLESTGSDAQRARDFYRTIGNNYDTGNTKFVDPMISHIDLDEEFEHGSVMSDVISPIKIISEEQANLVLQTVVIFKETLTMWFEDIVRVYSRKNYDPKAIYYSYMSNPPV